jgi:hypothetical protein
VILDEPIECPRCGVSTSVVDEVTVNGKVVVRLCSKCAPRSLDEMLVRFRKLVVDITAAVDKRCPVCDGQGWKALRTGRGNTGGTGVRVSRCAACVGTGVDMQNLLEALEICEKPRPARGGDEPSFPGRESGRNRHR